MYASIDRDRLVFCHKHEEHAVVNNLVTIEVAHAKATILPITNGRAFNDFTLTELKILYQNTTGHKFEGFSHLHLQELVLAAARALPVSDVNAFEASRQALVTLPDKEGSYKYVKGAYRPALQDDLFAPTALQAQHVAGAPTAPSPVAAHVSTAAAPIVPVANETRKGNTAVIWDTADRMWTDAGHPMQLPKILALRKQIMTELETVHGIKKTTSSTALGGWQKVRCPA